MRGSFEQTWRGGRTYEQTNEHSNLEGGRTYKRTNEQTNLKGDIHTNERTNKQTNKRTYLSTTEGSPKESSYIYIDLKRENGRTRIY